AIDTCQRIPSSPGARTAVKESGWTSEAGGAVIRFLPLSRSFMLALGGFPLPESPSAGQFGIANAETSSTPPVSGVPPSFSGSGVGVGPVGVGVFGVFSGSPGQRRTKVRYTQPA